MKGSPIRKITPYLYVAPAVALAMLFAYRPFLLTIADSFFRVRPSGEWIAFNGIGNYRTLFSSASFHDSLKNTFVFTAMFVPLNLFITGGLAQLCNRDTRLMRFSRVLLMIPLAVAMSSFMLIMRQLFDENTGLVNRILSRPIPWFSDGKWAMRMLVWSCVYLDLGFDFLLFTASLRNIPYELKEVSFLEGANAWQRFRYLEFPLCAPTFVYVLVINMRDAILICSPVMVLTQGGPYRQTQTLIYQMYLEGFNGGNIAIGSAIATVVFGMTFVLMLIILAVQKRRVFFQ